MPLINLSHLEMVLSAIDAKFAETSDEQLLLWLSNEGMVKPTASASGEIYTTNNNEIYIL